jgi:heat shock protein HslJ
MAGSDSCNRISGSYKRNGESLTFGQMIATQMACPDTGDTERAFREALKDVNRWRTVGNRLELFDATGTRRAIFEARTAP